MSKGGDGILPQEESGSEGGLPLRSAEDGDVLQGECDFTLRLTLGGQMKAKKIVHHYVIFFFFFSSVPM